MESYTHGIMGFQQETAGFSFRECGAYSRMLDIYYATERPLPSSRAMLYLALQCTSLTDHAAVNSVIRKLWKETPTGWIHKRDQYVGGWVIFQGHRVAATTFRCRAQVGDPN
jgi:uncharacterized protein YdaU (DUF1376 family)